MHVRRRADDVIRMNGLARTGGSKELLRWVSGRAEGWAGLLGGDGSVLHGVARVPERTSAAAPALASSGARELTALGARSLSVDQGPHTALLFSLDGPADVPPPVLAVVARRPLPAGLTTLLADAALPLAMCWAAESVERKRRRVDLAESRGREAVLHLLMTGQLSIAHQVAGALRPSLPDPVRVCVVECPGRGRDEVARICADLSGGRSWIVRCPVYARHLILVVPAGPDPADGRLGPEVASVVDDCVVGISEDVPLADTATAYRQAFHALAVARGLAERHARFGAAPEPALVAGAEGARWADALLAPLLTHLPRRSQDPGSQELAATLASWLAFSSHATEHLKIHRNTLAARLRLIGEVLGLDLHRVAGQAALDLALRIRATPALPRRTEAAGEAPAPDRSPDALLCGPAMRSWAVQQLRPLDVTAAGGGADPHATLRTWLAHETQTGPAAEALGISVPGLRKRLTRLETVLGRSLLRPPSARYDLWLAFRALDLTEGGQPDGGRPRP